MRPKQDMPKRVTRKDKDAELMGDDIIGIFLSEELYRDSDEPTEDIEPKLRRFIYDQEGIQNPRLIDSGTHGAVVLADIKGVEYALKVVSKAAIHWAYSLFINI
jgi:hypothetical protein